MLTFLDPFSDIFTHGSVSWHFCTETAKYGIFKILSDNFTHIKPVVLDSGSLFRHDLLLSISSQKRSAGRRKGADIIKLRRSHLWSVSFWSPFVWNSKVIIIVKNFSSQSTSDLSQFVSHQSSKKQVLVKSWLTFPQKKYSKDYTTVDRFIHTILFRLIRSWPSYLINFVRGESSVAKEIQNANQKCYFSDHFKVGFQSLTQRCRSWVRLSSNPSRCS